MTSCESQIARRYPQQLNLPARFRCTRGVRPAESEALGNPRAEASLDEHAFEALVAPHLPVLMAIARRLVGSDEAKDVVQESLLRAWRRWSTYDASKGTERAWLAAIVVNRARRHRHYLHGSQAQGLLENANDVAHESDHAERLAIETAIRSLPRRQREVVVLYYLADLSVEDTARSLGLRQGTVKAHLSGARTKLRTALETL